MRKALLHLVLGSAVLASVCHAQTPAQPRRLGQFGAWTAVTLGEGAQRICYAFTRATRSEGGGARQGVMLTITHRVGSRDGIVVSAGYAYPRSAEANASVGGTELPLYTAGQNAAPRDTAAALRAFRNGREVVVRGPGPNGRGQATDTFSLAGFGQAHDAISRECPAARQ